MIEIGTLLQDRFLIEEQIGVGGMGAVYRAVDQKFGTTIAIKETLYRDQELAEAFEREARLLNGLHHPLFPHVSDHFTDGEGHFLVMEYIEGEDLSEFMKRGERFDLGTVMEWTLDLLDGVDYLHSQTPPIIHRDIKPGNLRLTSRGNIVLLDFGMAKETAGNTLGMRSVFGYSRRYSPLEQIEGTGTDERSDVFSLGATIFHLLTGEPPVDALRRASAIVAGRPDPLRPAKTVNPQVPERISAILDSALALNPDNRFVSARAMWSAIEHSLRDGRVPTGFQTKSLAVASPVVQPVESFPALEVFEAETAMEAAPTPDPEFRWVPGDEKDPFAELVAQRVGQMRAAGHPDAPRAPALELRRIEVPIVADPLPVAAVESEVVTRRERPAIEPASDPVPYVPSARPRRNNYPIFLGIPLLLLILGLTGYALLSNSPGGDEEALQKTPAEQPSPRAENVQAEVLPVLPDEPALQTPVVSSESPQDAAVPEGQDRDVVQVPNKRNTASQVTESVPAYRPTSPEQKRSEPEPVQAKNRTVSGDRDRRSTRPRVVEEDAEQPPVSSIESIMTGIPAGRPMRQQRWEVLEEDQLRRERRIRRIERRNRQRWPLF